MDQMWVGAKYGAKISLKSKMQFFNVKKQKKRKKYIMTSKTKIAPIAQVPN